MDKIVRVSCRKNPNGLRPDVFFANAWSVAREQLGHGEGRTRAEAIRNAKSNAAERAATKGAA